MSLYIPKQRAKNSFRLARDDLTPRRASTHLEDLDLAAMTQTYVPHRFSGGEIRNIPVYDREKNRIARCSRIVSMPPVFPRQPTVPENVVCLQPATGLKPANLNQDKISTQEKKHDIQDLETSLIITLDPGRVEMPAFSHRNSVAETRTSWFPVRNVRRHSERPISTTRVHENRPETRFENPEFLLNTSRTDFSKRPPVNSTEFPKFVPQYRGPRPNSKIPPVMAKRIGENPSNCRWLQNASHTSVSSPETYESSRNSGSGSQFSAEASETDLLSMEGCDLLDILSYYTEDRKGSTENIHHHDDSPPEPPKHLRRIMSEVIRPNDRQPHPIFNLSKPSLDFCLDMGAEYEKSRFMIPEENKIPRPAVRYPKNKITIRKRTPENKPKENHSMQSKGDRRSVSTKELISAFKSGFGITSR